MSLLKLMESELPLNRKERFYTGTVFPMIVCQDKFGHLSHFTSLIDGYRQQPIDVTASHTNIQFFTEYSLVESIYGKAVERFPHPPGARDTPDIMILVAGQSKVLIALEAKMFLSPSSTSLRRQMKRQQVILDYLTDILEIDRIHHCALLPKQWLSALDEFEYPIMTWNSLYDRFIDVRPDDYFLEILKIALDNFDSLVSMTSGDNSEGRLKGEVIYDRFHNQTLPMQIMGRKDGLYGKRMQDDLQSGSWRTQSYEVSPDAIPPNSNWFAIADFVELIDSQSG